MTDVGGNSFSYTYDALNRLTQATQKNSAGTQLASDAYAYDPVGNMTSKTVNGTTTPMSYNVVDELTTVGSKTYSYDLNGNETGVTSGPSFAYNPKDQTTSITPSGGSAISMTYRGPNQTERVTAGGTSYQYDDTGISSSTTGPSTTYFTNSPDGDLISERIPNGASGCTGTTSAYCVYYYLYDGLGSVVGVTDSTGAVKDSYAYDPHGNTTSVTEVVPNPFRFIGAIWDSSTGLLKMGERYYDPSVGRFTQLDPAGEGYLYGDDDPVNETDPSGLCPMCLAAPLAGGLAIPGVGEALLATAVVVGMGVAAYQVYNYATRAGGSGEERSHFPKYSTKKRAYEAAKRASASGQEPIHHPSDPHGPHYHAANSKGKPRHPNVHYKYPPFK
jgi:RHS repeat-associated protein